MKNIINYKGYTGSVEFNEKEEIFCGKVIGINAKISFKGNSARELIDDFHASIDKYLTLCDAENIKPEKSFKGSFNIRISPELHKEAANYAAEHDMSLNSFVEHAISNQLGHMRI